MPVDEDFLRQLFKSGKKGGLPKEYKPIRRKEIITERQDFLEKEKLEVDKWIKRIEDVSTDIKEFLKDLKEYSVELYNKVVEKLEEFYEKLSKKLERPVHELMAGPLPEEGRRVIKEVFEERRSIIEKEQQKLDEEKKKLEEQLLMAHEELNFVYTALSIVVILILLFLFWLLFTTSQDNPKVVEVPPTTFQTQTIITITPPISTIVKIRIITSTTVKTTTINTLDRKQKCKSKGYDFYNLKEDTCCYYVEMSHDKIICERYEDVIRLDNRSP